MIQERLHDAVAEKRDPAERAAGVGDIHQRSDQRKDGHRHLQPIRLFTELNENDQRAHHDADVERQLIDVHAEGIRHKRLDHEIEKIRGHQYSRDRVQPSRAFAFVMPAGTFQRDQNRDADDQNDVQEVPETEELDLPEVSAGIIPEQGAPEIIHVGFLLSWFFLSLKTFADRRGAPASRRQT